MFPSSLETLLEVCVDLLIQIITTMNTIHTRGIITDKIIVSCVLYGRTRVYDETTLLWLVVFVTCIVVESLEAWSVVDLVEECSVGVVIEDDEDIVDINSVCVDEINESVDVIICVVVS